MVFIAESEGGKAHSHDDSTKTREVAFDKNVYSKTRRARFAKRNPNRARHSAPERSEGIEIVPLPFVSPTHPLARAVDDRDVDFVTAREKYSHPPREPK
jgi:hypothetical protein